MNVTEKSAQECAQTDSLEQVKRRFERWRASRKRGQHIPRPLWDSAVILAKEHGLERIASELRIKYDGLKKQLEGGEVPGRAVVGEARFVELFAPTSVGACECVVELQNARGARMRIQLKGGDLAGLASLSSSFWSAP
jgi:hypothetical protein